MIISSIKTVFTLLLLIGVGYLISHLGWYKKEDKRFLSNLIINIAIPALLINTFFKVFPRELLIQSGPMIVLSIISLFLTYIISVIFAKILRLEKNRKTSFTSVSTLSNSVFIGLPVATSIYGEESVPFVMIYYVLGVVMLWTFIAPKFTEKETNKEDKIKGILENLLSIPLITVVLSITLSLLGFKMPDIILTPAEYLGGMSTPLSLIFIGGVIYEVGLKNMKADPTTIFSMLIKFVISPLTIVFLSKFISIGDLGVKALAVVAGMPPMTQLGVISSNLPSEEEYVMVAIGILTLTSLIFIPINTSVVPILMNM